MATFDPVIRDDLGMIRTHALQLGTTPSGDVLTDGLHSMLEIRTAYRQALQTRDETAAYLYTHHGWSLIDIAHAICGHRHHSDRAGVIVGWANPPAHIDDPVNQLYEARDLVNLLHELLSVSTAAVTEQLTAPVPVQAHREPVRRLVAADERLQQVRTFRDTAEATRDIMGATLVAHHGFRLRQVAAIAQADPADIAAAIAVAKLSPPSDADTTSLYEIAALTRALDTEADRLARLHRAAESDYLTASGPVALLRS